MIAGLPISAPFFTLKGILHALIHAGILNLLEIVCDEMSIFLLNIKVKLLWIFKGFCVCVAKMYEIILNDDHLLNGYLILKKITEHVSSKCEVHNIWLYIKKDNSMQN